jgi:hypothetical protein
MAKKRAKAAKLRKSTRPKDLGVATRKSAGVKGGTLATQLKTDIVKTAAPAGPVPIPYPN